MQILELLGMLIELITNIKGLKDFVEKNPRQGLWVIVGTLVFVGLCIILPILIIGSGSMRR